jgi:TRAP-type mannitol/chloroaromatic compound transport system substrate-binding protein
LKKKGLLKLIGAIFLAAMIAIPFATGCAPEEGPTPEAPTPEAPTPEAPTPAPEQEVYKWKFQITSTPGMDPYEWNRFVSVVEDVKTITQGQLDIELYAIGELVPLSDMLEATGGNVLQMDHCFSNQWAGKNSAFEVLGSYSFGPTHDDWSVWYSAGDGQKYLDALYHPFNIQAFPDNDSFGELGGHSDFPINSVDDMVGKDYRIGAGTGQEILKRLGINAMWCAGEEIYSNLDRGVVDIVKWGNVSSNWGMKMHEIAGYIYWPGWQKPGEVHFFEINKDRYEELPAHLQTALVTRIRANEWVNWNRAYKEGEFWKKYIEYGTKMTRLPDAEICKIKNVADEVLAEEGDKNPMFKEILENHATFLKDYREWAQYNLVPSNPCGE